MQYRRLGKLEWKPSALGFGAMRLPQTDSDMAHVNEAEAIRMIRYAIDQGVNYVDTALPYHKGVSEVVVGKALSEGYREKVKLATKMTSFMMKEAADIERNFNRQLAKLQTDKIDFYLLHGLNRMSWRLLQEWKALPWAERKMGQGQIGHLAFSFHDDYQNFQQIVDGYDNWTFCQIQYNYMDIQEQAGRRGLEYAAAKGLGVVVMEPIKGGLLALEPLPEGVAKLWQSAAVQRSPAEWALQWVWNQPEVSLVLSGMSNLKQVEENVAAAGRSGVGQMTAGELAVVDRVREAYRGLRPIGCSQCRYCQPCPSGVAIAEIFNLYNEAAAYDNYRLPRNRYMGEFGGLKESQRGDKCQDCGQCEEVCPQKVPVREWLKKAHAQLHVKDYKSPFA